MALNFPQRMLYESGRWGVEIEGTYRKVFEDILERSAPLTTEALLTATELIHDKAYKMCPVGRNRRDSRTGVFPRKHSKYMLTSGVQIGKGGAEVTGFVRNMAPWSWAVVWSQRTAPLGMNLGAKVGRDLIIKPAREMAPRIAQFLALELSQAGKV